MEAHNPAPSGVGTIPAVQACAPLSGRMSFPARVLVHLVRIAGAARGRLQALTGCTTPPGMDDLWPASVDDLWPAVVSREDIRRFYINEPSEGDGQVLAGTFHGLFTAAKQGRKKGTSGQQLANRLNFLIGHNEDEVEYMHGRLVRFLRENGLEMEDVRGYRAGGPDPPGERGERFLEAVEGHRKIVCGRVRCRYERLVLGANQRARSAEPSVFRHGWVYTTPEPVAGGGSPGCTRLPGAMPEPAAGSGAQGRTGPTDAMPVLFEPRLRLYLGVEEGDVEDLRECTLHTYLDWGWAVRLLSRCLRWACLLCSWLIVTVGIIVAVQRWAGRDIDVQVHFEVASREAWASIAGVWRSTARAVRRDLEVSTRTA